MNELQTFSNAELGSVRTVAINGEPYFVGKDIAEILGYSNSRKAIGDHVDEEDKMDGVTIRDSIGREQTPVLINESGLYSLILSSTLPNAKRFKRWVTSEVLPIIRKTGAYSLCVQSVVCREIRSHHFGDLVQLGITAYYWLPIFRKTMLGRSDRHHQYGGQNCPWLAYGLSLSQT